MCGIVGLFNALKNHNSNELMVHGLHKLRMRGPDDKGIQNFSIGDGELLLGQTRLSIIDLSSDGHQPMYSSDGNYCIIFNGEIYNYLELRKELILKGYDFVTETDTEVLLTSWIHWGPLSLDHLDGMFAFSIFDIKKNKLYIVRDAFGIKPLYYSMTSNSFHFASEIEAIKAVLNHEQYTINIEQAVSYLVSDDHDSGRSTFYNNINNLLPGNYLEIQFGSNLEVKENTWWRPSIVENKSIKISEAADEVRHLFLQALRRQLRSDVPIGAALSGGIDSSSIVCGIRYLERELPINTFSYIAKDSSVSEEKWIDTINKNVNAKSHKVYVTQNDFINDIDDFIYTQGEPLGGTSYYAEYRVYKLAKENEIKVMLDGHGADEVFGGYNGYPKERITSHLSKLELRKALLFSYHWAKWPGRKYNQAILLFASGIKSYFNNDFRFIKIPTPILNLFSGIDVKIILKKEVEVFDNQRALSYRLRNDLLRASCPPQLRGADRSAMKRSIENRVPFLNKDLASFSLTLPESYLVSPIGRTKEVFRIAMKGIVPDEILDRKDKIGYAPAPGLRIPLTPNLKFKLDESISKLKFLNAKQAYNLMNQGDPQSILLEGISWRIFNLLRWVDLLKVVG